MRKKIMKIVIAVVILILLVLVGWYVLFSRFGIGPVPPFLYRETVPLEGFETIEVAEEPLMATVDSEEEAENIAQLYGITLVSYENGLALYRTDENVFDVLARGQKNGYPQLSINGVRTIDEE
jgi:flagellar basal body-associated protein FliL